jgi:hypothetical protein
MIHNALAYSRKKHIAQFWPSISACIEYHIFIYYITLFILSYYKTFWLLYLARHSVYLNKVLYLIRQNVS